MKDRAYPVAIENSRLERLTTLLKKNAGKSRLFVFYDANLYALHGTRLRETIGESHPEHEEFIVPSGEKHKSAKTLNGIYEFLLDRKVSRNDFILVCGGGVTSDLVGYAAATTLRGIKFGIVSTTLLGMIDAAIGGKTGINHASGKNLIGAFWQPQFVFGDLSFLFTLPPREFMAAIGEMAKYAGLIGPSMVTKVSAFLSDPSRSQLKTLQELILRCVEYKADIVARDEREGHLRMRLNLGHTFAHGIENGLGYGKLRHGEAVTLGLLAAVELSEISGVTSTDTLVEYRNLLQQLVKTLPVRALDSAAISQAMTLDKKRASHSSRYVVLKAVGKPIIADNISSKQAALALGKMIAFYRVHGGTGAKNSDRQRTKS